MIKESFKVSGMTCATCAISLESYLKPLNGVSKVSVNYPNQSVSIEYQEAAITPETFKLKANEIGYEIFIDSLNTATGEFEKSEERRLITLRSKLLFSALLSIPVFVISMFFMEKLPYQNWILFALSTPVLIWGGSEFFVIAWKKLKRLSTNMDTLVAMSTGVAYIYSVANTIYPKYFLDRGIAPHVYYESAVIIITLILLGRFLEERAKRKATFAIKKLIGLKPKEVTVIRNGKELVIPYSDIAMAELVVLKPGDRIPVDGIVRKGDSFVDESMITGEPISVRKMKGDEVYAGTINQKGMLRVLASKVGNETLLAQIIRLVEEAQASKPNIQKLVDRVASVFVPTVILLAVITFLVWYFIGPEPSFTYALVGLITVLIIACPCALGLATPTALMVGIGKGAEKGILIKDAQVLETAYKIDTLVIDKTGTITEGRPHVTDMVWADKARPAFHMQVLLAIESASEHPLAEAIVDELKERGTTSVEMDAFISHTGLGVEAKVSGDIYYVGNQRLLDDHRVEILQELSQAAQAFESEGKTVVFLGSAIGVLGVIAISDQLKISSREAVKEIQDMGIAIHMMTGDNEKSAAIIAKEVGIKQFKANVMPSEKGGFVKQLQEEGKVVAMVGDGINDSHALAQADVGIAMASGTDIAMESAGITLMHSDLKQISRAIALSKATMRTIRQNLFWAFIYNLIAIPIAAGALYPAFGFLLNPMIAGAAMSLSSISVVMNSLRLKQSTF